jgi:RimJ/RimL family protein N-acetyltransferase
VRAIATRRLELRPLGESDLSRLHQHWSVPEVGRWLWDQEVPTREQIAAELGKSLDSFATLGFGIWGLHERAAGGFVGTCGLLPVPEGTGEIEILFTVEPRCWRRGFAAEAAASVIRYGFEEAGLSEIVGRCDAPNEPSRRLLEKLGMELVRRAPIRGVDCLHYRLVRGTRSSHDGE